MTNIERIEQILNEWKAKSKRFKEMNHDRSYKSCQDTILGLHLALDVIKEPSNTRMHTGDCKVLHYTLKEHWVGNECPVCGERLRR